MFEVYNDTLCVYGGWLYKTAQIMKKHQYDNYKRRGPFRVIRNGRGKNSPALIAWSSIHPEYQDQIIKQYGNPEITSKHIIFTEYLERDPKASVYYAKKLLDDGSHLPQGIQLKHSAEASILAAINRVINDRIIKTRALGNGSLSNTWLKVSEIIHQLPRETWPHGLPKNARSLKRKYKAFLAEGYSSLIHAGHGHKNSEKINSEARLWILARYSNMVHKIANMAQLLEEYNELALQEGWKVLKHEKTLHNYLYKPEIKSQWYANRRGELKAKEKYSYIHSTKMPTMRDSLWYGDGTKMNLYYLNAKGKMATCQVYEVMDAYSEAFLGYHISKTEDYEAQYNAYKMAVQTSGHRPYEIKFDNQGGHKKLEAGDFLGRLSKLALKTQPYNGKSKTIESAFGRFQMQIIKKHWFFTGQNITANTPESRQNMEFILANVENLPTLDEAKAVYKTCRDEWNRQPHYSSGLPKMEMYLNSSNPKAPAIDMFQMVDIFWILRKKPVTCTAYGIMFSEKNVKHNYVVYNEERLPDFEFLNNNVDRKFYIRFDPNDMSLIYLYEKMPNGDLRFVTEAETKVVTARGKQEQEEFDTEYLAKVNKMNKDNRIEKRDSLNEILEKFGMTPEQQGLNSPTLKGIEKKKRKTKEPTSIGQYQKELSNKVGNSSDGDFDYDEL